MSLRAAFAAGTWGAALIRASPCEGWSVRWLSIPQKFTTPIKASSTRLPPTPHVCKRLGFRLVWQNGYAERLIRTIKEEEVDLSEYQDYADAMRQIGRFLDEVYMHKRIHSSLGYLTPAEFESQWRQEQSTLSHMN
jgi:Integrase core domain